MGLIAFDRSLETMRVVWAIKYAAASAAILFSIGRSGYQSGLGDVVDRLSSPFTISFLSGIPVVVAAILWMWKERPAYGLLMMGAIGLDAMLKVARQGPYFLNHYLLQAVIGVIGVLAVGRVLAGHPTRDAWRPLALLGVMVWGLAATKKLLHGTYLDGEYLVAVAGQGRETALGWISGRLLSRQGASEAPARCCVSDTLDVALWVVVAFVLLGALLVLAELSPVLVWAFVRDREVLAWLMLVLAVAAAALTDELDFGLTNIGLAALWGQGLAFRRSAIGAAAVFAPVYAWEFVT